MTAPFVEVVSEAALADRVSQLGEEIADDYRNKTPVLLGVLHGSLIFLADLARHMHPDLEIEFLSLTRFGEEGRVNIAMDTLSPLQGKDVIIVEDIVDTGLTLTSLRRIVSTRDLASLATVTLLDKAPRRIVDVPIEYRGFEVGDEFLLGYGLDWDGRYRNVRSLWAVLDVMYLQEHPDSLAHQVFGTQADRLTT